MDIIPKKYRFNKVAYVDADGNATSLQTGNYKIFKSFNVYAYSQAAAYKKANRKCKAPYSAVIIRQ